MDTADDRGGGPSELFGFRADAFELIKGAIDVHVHGYPEVSLAWRNRGPDRATIDIARAYGLSGWVLKSHLYPTVDRAHLLQESITEDDFQVFGSITLNPIVGGISPAVVEVAVAHGAKVIFLPTWGSTSDVTPGSYILRVITRDAPSFYAYAEANAGSLVDGNGRLKGNVTDVIDSCKSLDVSLATGHIPITESFRVAEYARGIGFERLLITHPQHLASGPAQLVDLAAIGPYIEFNNAPLFHPEFPHTIRELHESLEAVGTARSILTTDVFSRWAPPEPEALRIFAEQLHYFGWSKEDLAQMLCVNPRSFLAVPDLP